MGKTKDKLYYYFAEKNWGVRREYPEIKAKHDQEGDKIGKWIKLIRLNLHYRVLRKTNWCFEEYAKEKKTASSYFIEAESAINNRTTAHFFAKSLLEYDAIVLDMFDVLVLEPYTTKKTAYEFVGELVDGGGTYAEIRENVEKEFQKDECTIYDIYTAIEQYLGRKIIDGPNKEMSKMIDFYYVNPYMSRVYNILKANNKELIISAHSVYPIEFLQNILIKCGYTGEFQIINSNNCAILDGKIYKTIKTNKIKKITYVGSRQILLPKDEQIVLKKFEYKSSNDIGKKYRAEWMSPLLSSAYSGIVNNYLHNGLKQYSYMYEYGFICGGIYILGFCNWLHNNVNRNQIEKILFISSNGETCKKIYTQMFSDCGVDVLQWSEITTFILLMYNDKSQFIQEYCRLSENLQRELFVIFPLELKDCLENLLEVKNNNDKTISLLFEKYWDALLCHNEKNLENLWIEVNSCIFGCKKIAIVDMDISSIIAKQLKIWIRKMTGNMHEIFCYLSADEDTNQNIGYLRNVTDSYLFSNNKNRHHQKMHIERNNTAAFNLLNKNSSATFFYIDNEGNYVYLEPEVELYETYDEIQNGICDFIYVFLEMFKNEKGFLNISGFDAYRAFEFISRNNKKFNNKLKHHSRAIHES